MKVEAVGLGFGFELVDQVPPMFDLCRRRDVVEALHHGADETPVFVGDVRERHRFMRS